MPLRVVFFLPHFDAGGVERVVLNLLRHLNRQHFTPSLILGEKKGALLSLVPDDIPIYDLEGRPARWVVPALMRRLSTDRIQVAYGGTNAANLALLAATCFMANAPAIIASEHTPPDLYLRGAKWRSFRVNAMRFLYRKAACIAVPLQEVGAELRATLNAPDLPIAVLPNPVFDPASLETDDSDVSLPWDCDKKHLFVSVGRLVRLKGFDVLLTAFAKLTAQRPEFKLVIVGEGPERPALEQLIGSLSLTDNVHLAGMVANPFSFLRRSSGLVLASRFEGFGNVLIEAMACGVPVISTDCPFGPRIILQDGAAGVLVRPDAPDELCSAMNQLLDGRISVNQLIENGRRRACDFSTEIAVPKFEALLKRIIQRN